MKNQVSFGVNKTGIQMSPVMSKEMEQGYKEFPPIALDTSMTSADLKQTYVREADAVGSVPLPGTLHGAVSTGMQMIKGDNPEIIIDKLGERLAFERSGVRLYDALIMKAEVARPESSLDMLHQIRSDEADHFAMIRDAIESIGGDPTAQTPCADVTGVSTMGLMQVVNDPRTTLAQCVQAILIAELADNDGWALLIQLVNSAGMTEMADKFREAKAAEERHLEFMREWLQELTLQPEAEIKH